MKITICRKSHFNSAHKLYNKTWSKDKNLKVFGKQGEKCPRCEYKITKTKVAQRGTHFCKKCQKK